MGRGDFGFDGIHSLKAVDQWIAVINSNLNATSRIAYKGTKVKFRGGVTEIFRSPQNSLQGIQLPESTIHVDQTSIDFSQGSIINSDELSHLGIQGQGFFMLSSAVASGPQFYSRDGEFHVNAANQLISSAGLFLVFNAAGTAVTLANVAAGNLNSNMLANTSTPNFLKFSQYGATVFELGTATMTTMVAGASNVLSQTLETSNTSLSQTLPELSLAQKFFTAVTKIISVHQTNLDTVINLIR